ncbi:MAG: glycosyltransferase [Chitinophagaceae bacterium]|nr:glycosyltransferase [Chitinophagaceae bacterium]
MGETISIITICYNNPAELIETCNSVNNQSECPFEHLIIDGSNNENILNWYHSAQQPAYRRLIHEPDEGIADAFNKGIKNASGTIIHLLNAGDRFTDTNTLHIVKKKFEADSTLMWTHSRYIQHRGHTDVISGLPFEKNKLWKGMRQTAHPTMFLKKELYNRYGLYNLQYKIAMDYDMLVRIRNEKFLFIHQPLVYFAPGGASNAYFTKGLEEVRNSYSFHIGKSRKQGCWQWLQKALHLFMKTGLGKFWFRAKNKANTV